MAGCGMAQNKNAEQLASYKILTTDSVYVTPKNLKKNQPVMLVYFSPDCSHCMHLMHEIKEDMKPFNKVQVVMITWTSYKMIKAFYRDFGLSQYPNFTVGTEGYSYKVQQYYGIKTTPFVAIYTGKGELVKAFVKQPKIAELVTAIKKA